MRAILTVGLLLLAACSSAPLEELRRVEPRGTPYQQALARHYLDLSDREAAQYDWWGSQRFAEKGLAAAYGRDVPPETFGEWDEEVGDRQERQALAEARRRLMLALKQASSAEAAQAQVYFDCWLHEAGKLGDTALKQHCRSRFDERMAALPSGSAAVPGRPAAHPDPLLSAPDLTLSYLVFFDWNSDRLNQDAIDILQIILTDLHNINSYQIVLNGHTDTSGSQERNMQLSLGRAKAVRDWLKASGIPEQVISLFAFGETDPKEPTGDGVRAQVNRRVEVFIE